MMFPTTVSILTVIISLISVVHRLEAKIATPSFKSTKTPSATPIKKPSMKPSQKIISASVSSNFLTGNSDVYSLAEGYSTLNLAIPYLTLSECQAQCLGMYENYKLASNV